MNDEIEQFQDALDAGGVCHDREAGWVDATSGEIVKALLTAGWTPPKAPVTRENPGPWPYDDLAQQEWPHVPLQLARAYADEYVQTGRRP